MIVLKRYYEQKKILSDNSPEARTGKDRPQFLLDNHDELEGQSGFQVHGKYTIIWEMLKWGLC